MSEGRIALTCRVALGLAHEHLTPTLGATRLILQGRLHLWPGWEKLPLDDQRRIARLLAHRPDALTYETHLRDHLRSVLKSAEDFECTVEDVDMDWDTAYRPVPGRPCIERIDDWLAKLDAHHRPAPRRSYSPESAKDGLVLTGGRCGFRLPTARLPTPTLAIDLGSSPEVLELGLAEEDFRDLARRIDAKLESNISYEQIAVDQLLGGLEAPGGGPLETLSAGRTKLLVAPTGTGKSVFSRLVALHLAEQGVPVAIVTPDVASAWREVRRLERAAQAAQLDVGITTLSSWRGQFKQLCGHMDRPPRDDPAGAWALQRQSYTCLLSAYSTTAPPSAGQEPCTSLRQVLPTGKTTAVRCPFDTTCGRFSAYQAAATADIIVTNHHALLSGRVPVPVSVDGQAPRRMTVAEFLLERCGALFIDEVDAFQNVVISSNSRGAALSGARGRRSMIYQALLALEEHHKLETFDFERGRRALMAVAQGAERLSDALNDGHLTWPRQPLTWCESYDGWLATRLFPEAEDGTARLRTLFDSAPIPECDRSERLRLALRPVIGSSLDDSTLDAIRAELQGLLTDSFPALRGQRDRGRLIDRLMLRALLCQVNADLRRLRSHLAAYAQFNLPEVTALRDGLLGYAPWSPSPAGPLGQRLFGFSFPTQRDDSGVIETRALAGDPHGYVAELGDVTALALCGKRRVVLGLSATARFRGSPTADVLSPVCAALPDTTKQIHVSTAPVSTRISGVQRPDERQRAAQEAAAQLWKTSLGGYLEALRSDQDAKNRARALVVTGSYAEAQAATRGLLAASRNTGTRVLCVVSDSSAEIADDTNLPRRRIEEFGSVPAPAILVAPLSVVARGHNILQPNTSRSAITGIFVLTRPVPPSGDASRFLAHIAYQARLAAPTWRGDSDASLTTERDQAFGRLRRMQQSPALFSRMDPQLRREIVCDVLVDLCQLVGRARRGNTPVDLYFVDAAFNDSQAHWADLISEVLTWWESKGWLEEMDRLHHPLVHALTEYAAAHQPQECMA